MTNKRSKNESNGSNHPVDIMTCDEFVDSTATALQSMTTGNGRMTANVRRILVELPADDSDRYIRTLAAKLASGTGKGGKVREGDGPSGSKIVALRNAQRSILAAWAALESKGTRATELVQSKEHPEGWTVGVRILKRAKGEGGTGFAGDGTDPSHWENVPKAPTLPRKPATTVLEPLNLPKDFSKAGDKGKAEWLERGIAQALDTAQDVSAEHRASIVLEVLQRAVTMARDLDGEAWSVIKGDVSTAFATLVSEMDAQGPTPAMEGEHAGDKVDLSSVPAETPLQGDTDDTPAQAHWTRKTRMLARDLNMDADDCRAVGASGKIWHRDGIKLQNVLVSDIEAWKARADKRREEIDADNAAAGFSKVSNG